MSASLIDRMEFYSRLAREGHFGGGTLSVAFVLLYRFFNAETGRCDPGQSRIAREAGVSARHVKRATDELRIGGWFDVAPGAGSMTRYGPTTSYIPRFQRVTNPSGDDESVRGDGSVTGDRFGRQGVTNSSARTSKEPVRVVGASTTAEDLAKEPAPSASFEPDRNVVRLPLAAGEVAPQPGKRKRSAVAPRQNNLGALVGYQPSPEHLAYMRREFPNVVSRWEFELRAMKDNQTVRDAFEKGARSEAWPTFRQWMTREERRALERAAGRSNAAARTVGKPVTSLIAGTPEAEAVYD